jgi:hypothetical protein
MRQYITVYNNKERIYYFLTTLIDLLFSVRVLATRFTTDRQLLIELLLDVLVATSLAPNIIIWDLLFLKETQSVCIRYLSIPILPVVKTTALFLYPEQTLCLLMLNSSSNI